MQTCANGGIPVFCRPVRRRNLQQAAHYLTIPRHPELVSGSMVQHARSLPGTAEGGAVLPHNAPAHAERWTLKQVQGDERAETATGPGSGPRQRLLKCWVVPLARLELARISPTDFESVASTIPPQGRLSGGARLSAPRAAGQSYFSAAATILCRREWSASLPARTCAAQTGSDTPLKLVTKPPASRTSRQPAALSHGLRSDSQNPS